MGYRIEKAAVIGSGTMGSGIAALLAGVGVDVLLLDVPARDTKPGDTPDKRNAVVYNNLKALQKARPSQLFSEEDLRRISVGNIDDDLGKLADRDWVIEVIVENLEIKRNLMAKVAEVVSPTAIVTTNTSGLPIHDIAAHLGDDFTRRFMGTHFFNPPRYLHLLEVIPHSNTDPELIAFMQEYGTIVLGKGVVICKDTPNFIGNRFMSMTGSQAMNYAMDHDYSVEEVDAITGPLIGRPKTATFNLNDLVGYDVAVFVARNLYPNIPDDPQRDMLSHSGVGELAQYMLDNKLLGRKTDGGFYKMVRENGKKELWALNLKTREYEPPKAIEFESVKKHGRVKPLGERIRLLLSEEDRAAQYLWHHHAFYLAYASQRVPEITESIFNVDNAQKWGFNHEMGPFEIWDAIGVAQTVPQFEAAGYPVADWVKQMLAKGCATFYQTKNGKVTAYYSPQAGDYVPVTPDPRAIRIVDLKADGKQIWSNGDGSIYDMGDGILLWEFTTKGNTITSGYVDAGYKALEILESSDQYSALVIGNEGSDYGFGANLDPQTMMASGNPLMVVEDMLTRLQTLTLKMKYGRKPTIAAPAGRALGGSAEMIMAANGVAAYAESYIGQTEVGVGLVPAGGGCKELVRRHVNPVVLGGGDARQPVRQVFEMLATAKVSESAKQAQQMGFLSATDKIVMNRDYLLGEAKALALAYAATYQPKAPEKVWAAGRDVYAAMLLGLEGFREAGYATDYDKIIGQKLARIVTGGALAEPQWVDQQVFLNLEKQVFKDLIMEGKTMERILHTLTTGKPLRN